MSPIKQFSNQKGIALLFVVLISSVILAIGAGVSVIVLQETKMVGQIGNSVVSFYAADSGVEEQLFNLYKTDPLISLDPNGITGNLFYSNNNSVSFISIAKCSTDAVNSDNCHLGIGEDPGCSAANYCIKSIGTFEKTQRAIEIKY